MSDAVRTVLSQGYAAFNTQLARWRLEERGISFGIQTSSMLAEDESFCLVRSSLLPIVLSQF